ncbi:polysaccharide pyruvyl transferase [Marinilabilia salmonicolor]|jgi:glycosyltransferase involved in cell wall biosynthesis|uniref:glycosyltransferase n=1 Tax=Marinilabilia salmonicolor TaxID=989 RepID=UPI000D07A13C|nr:glycosyltransferase [Marinilabilia salmonicolor]PRZ00813.1 polysaccharide pyruvyl transferase [Marinilabilia salmonicolor]
MNKNPLVSFCLFCYNQEKFIEEAIEGALNQTYSPLEIIISDDCSTDSTFQIIEKKVANYKGPHKLIVRQNQKNLGLAEHVNTVLYKVAKGEYLAMAAGDDISLPDRIDETIAFFNKKKDILAVSTGLKIIDKQGLKLKEQSITESKIYSLDFFLSKKYFHINGPSRTISRKVIHYFPPLSPSCPTEDTTFLLRCFILGSIGLLNKNLIKYRKHDSSITSPINSKSINKKEILNQYKVDLNHALSTGLINKKLYKRLLKKISTKLDYRNNKQGAVTLIRDLLNIQKGKIFIYKILVKLLPKYKNVLDLVFFQKIPLIDIISSKYNLRFFRKSTLIINGYTNSKNFGDALNKILIKKISNFQIAFFNSIQNSNIDNLLMIGSIIHLSNNRSIIWGAGCISENHLPKEDPLCICAVRGPLTRKLLLKHNIDCPEIYGDPALLFPLVYSAPQIKKKYKIGVIPHYIDKDHKNIKLLEQENDVLIIDIQTGGNFKTFVKQIHSCQYIISSSLHGLIISDAYNIPNAWISFGDKIVGNNFKFHDYFLSVKREEKEPISIVDNIDYSLIDEKLKKWRPISINLNLLLQAFPYHHKLKKITKTQYDS